MLFSGPIQPPMLGVSLAVSALLLTPEHERLQAALYQRIDRAAEACEANGIPLETYARAPIFLVQKGTLSRAVAAVSDLFAQGFFVCPSSVPAVPISRSGVRFTVSLHNEPEDIDALIVSIKSGIERSKNDGSQSELNRS
jgi:7-keto-8-aminopelargonate synthetase-like enzyme